MRYSIGCFGRCRSKCPTTEDNEGRVVTLSVGSCVHCLTPPKLETRTAYALEEREVLKGNRLTDKQGIQGQGIQCYRSRNCFEIATSSSCDRKRTLELSSWRRVILPQGLIVSFLAPARPATKKISENVATSLLRVVSDPSCSPVCSSSQSKTSCRVIDSA